ncbi:HxlR family transcriptional regulator [Gallibacterium salpingitidis]|uniref:HxlR family transcriptional regulator n=1 Tax=Gallibacterium salpingitidis TaxID=505341 RepID=A0A1A7Q1V0_9PAST|nr:helix-turn-helix domain-containing protein [Gallibacterium salpingitidis]OBW92133.1 HxlR family transcriptional regulator [Gallibacterium salpingitidis]OBX08026.1 HxlR family transcriptional regulator [Gallibacterium salpingitidis]OBX11272.1 HxlR family transcriptional regulator [Gallibacterium salpingitidis]WKT00675.1 helix-turn-helix transcriptional regulator [Gallibacterium salpingitidis]
MTRKAHIQFDCNSGCSVELALSVIGQKYKGTILYQLLNNPVMRFNEIKRLFPEVSQRTLTHQLRALEDDQIIIRTVYPEVPPRVEYQMSDYGRTLATIIDELKSWGDKHKVMINNE